MARTFDDRPAAIMSDSGQVLSYPELERRSVQLAGLLRARGLVRGDRVALFMENRLEWFIAMWGARRAGLFFVPVNWHLRPTEVRYVLENSDARALITTPERAEAARAATEGLEGLALRLCVGGGAGFEDFYGALDPYPSEAPPLEGDGGAMPYSSGTTGQPKGILRELSDGDRFGAPNPLEMLVRGMYGFDERTIYLSPAPLYHSAPVGFTGAVLAAGGAVVVMPSFEAEAALAAIERHRATHVQFVPTHMVRLLRLPPDQRSGFDLSSLKVVIHAAAPCPPTVKASMIEWLGPIVHEYYAGSERCGLTAIDSAEWLAHPGSVGRSRTGRIHIVDPETGRELPPGEVGVVYFEDPAPFAYHKDAAKTAAVRSPEGWGTHGDMGRVDEEGYLYLADRRSDLILSGGVNIYPQEIENVLVTHPAVSDAAVVGVPNEEFGQEVKAVLQLLPGAPQPSAGEVIAFCRERLASFKTPRSVDFVAELPRYPNGKLLRRELLERYRQGGPGQVGAVQQESPRRT